MCLKWGILEDSFSGTHSSLHCVYFFSDSALLPNQGVSIYTTAVISIGEDNGTSLQYSCLENPMGRGAWWAAVHGVAKSRTRLSDFTFTFLFHALEKEMATHSSVLAWRIPGTAEPGGLMSMVSHRVRHDWSDLAAAAVISIPVGSNSFEQWTLMRGQS